MNPSRPRARTTCVEVRAGSRAIVRLGRYANDSLERLRFFWHRLAMCDKALDVQFDRLSNVAFSFFERLALSVTTRQHRHDRDVAALFSGFEEDSVLACGSLLHNYTSRFRTSNAFSSMNLRRLSTSSPISVVKI